jgi:2'-5' RNA ligase
MLDLGFLSTEIKKLQEEICPCEVYDLESGHGLETEPHITVLYGLHVQQAKSIVDKIDLCPVTFKIKNISLFENEKFDVLKFGIESERLNCLNKELCEKFEYTNNYPDYKPHCTIGYLMPGTGHYYKKLKSELLGKEFTSNRFIFSNKYSDKVYITV